MNGKLTVRIIDIDVEGDADAISGAISAVVEQFNIKTDRVTDLTEEEINAARRALQQLSIDAAEREHQQLQQIQQRSKSKKTKRK